MSTIYLAGGCFWGLQKFFDQFDGVIRTEAGYANGPDKAPSYQEVCKNSGLPGRQMNKAITESEEQK